MTDSAVSLQTQDTRRAARNAAALALASIASKGALFLWQLVLTRLLAQADYGIYGTIGGMLVIAATLPEFGMGLIVLRDASQRRDLAGKMLSATLVMQPLLALVAYGGLVLAGGLLGYDEAIRGLLPLAGLSLFIDILGAVLFLVRPRAVRCSAGDLAQDFLHADAGRNACAALHRVDRPENGVGGPICPGGLHGLPGDRVDGVLPERRQHRAAVAGGQAGPGCPIHAGRGRR